MYVVYTCSAAEPFAEVQLPASKRQCMSTSPCYIEDQLVDLVRWKEEDGAIRELEINSNRPHNWTQNVGLELEDIETTECHHKRNEPSISGN